MTSICFSTDTLKLISSFLEAEDALNFLHRTSKEIGKNLDLNILDDGYSHELTDQEWMGPYDTGDQERIWFRLFPVVMQKQIHTIRFDCDYRDQGWGNRKGSVYIREDKNCNNYEGDIVASSPIAEHHTTKLSLQFHPKPGKNYTMCYRVGGGGGHELFVENPRIQSLVYCDKDLTDVANRIFNHESIKHAVQSDFGAQITLAAINSLIRDIECGEDPDTTFASAFDSIGLDTTSIDILKASRQFITALLEHKHETLTTAVASTSATGSNDDDDEDDMSYEPMEDDYLSNEDY